MPAARACSMHVILDPRAIPRSGRTFQYSFTGFRFSTLLRQTSSPT